MPTRPAYNTPPKKLISYAQYAQMKDDIRCTWFKIFPDGSSGYEVNGNIISVEDFNRANPLPASLVVNNSDSVDLNNNYMKS